MVSEEPLGEGPAGLALPAGMDSDKLAHHALGYRACACSAVVADARTQPHRQAAVGLELGNRALELRLLLLAQPALAAPLPTLNALTHAAAAAADLRGKLDSLCKLSWSSQSVADLDAGYTFQEVLLRLLRSSRVTLPSPRRTLSPY